MQNNHETFRESDIQKLQKGQTEKMNKHKDWKTDRKKKDRKRHIEIQKEEEFEEEQK